MEENQLALLRKIFNQLEIREIKQINERSVLLSFEKDIRLYIDSTASGIDFSLEAMTLEADGFLEKIS